MALLAAFTLVVALGSLRATLARKASGTRADCSTAKRPLDAIINCLPAVPHDVRDELITGPSLIPDP